MSDFTVELTGQEKDAFIEAHFPKKNVRFSDLMKQLQKNNNHFCFNADLLETAETDEEKIDLIKTINIRRDNMLSIIATMQNILAGIPSK